MQSKIAQEKEEEGGRSWLLHLSFLEAIKHAEALLSRTRLNICPLAGSSDQFFFLV